jgi:ParB family chromosome partitioning protein
MVNSAGLSSSPVVEKEVLKPFKTLLMSTTITTNEVVLVSTSKLRLNQLGVYTYSTPQNYLEIKENITELGIIQPVLVNPNDFQVISGNLRVQIARELGIEQIPVIFIDLSDDQMDMVFISSNIQREKSTLEKYREHQLINKIFSVVQGSRTDLNPQLKEEKEKKDQMKEGLTTYEINSFNRINKLAKEQFGDKFQQVVEKELERLQEKGKSLNTLVKKLERKPLTRTGKVSKQITTTLSKDEAIQQIKKVLNQVPPEQHQEVLSTLLEELYSQVG